MYSILAAIARRVRQSHALEHATMHLLGRLPEPPHLVGRSDWHGFVLYGEVATDAVRAAAQEALARLQAGQAELAVHPRCGTNLMVAVLLTGGLATVARGALEPALPEKRARRWSALLTAAVGALLAARPLGAWVQRHWMTTSHLEDVRIREVRREVRGGLVVHRVLLERETSSHEQGPSIPKNGRRARREL